MSILGVIIACIISAGIGHAVTKVIIYAAMRELIRDNPKLYEAMR